MQYLKTLLDRFEIRGNVAEIGTFKGEGSTPVLLDHVTEHGGEFYAFDIFTDDAVYAKVRKQLALPTAHAVKGLSVPAGRSFDKKLAFLFVDGDHGFPRMTPIGEQSGVALDILAWHHHLEPGAVLAFHDYTGSDSAYGEKSLMAVEHAVDSLVREPMYEPIGSKGSIRAFVKRTDDLLYARPKIKQVEDGMRPAWERLGKLGSVSRAVVWGTGETSHQVLAALREEHGHELEVVFTDSFTTEPGTVWGCPQVPFSPDVAGGDMLVLGTIFEDKVFEFMSAKGFDTSNCFGFYDFIGWHHVGRFGYR